MTRIVFVAGPLFSEGERQYLEKIVFELSSASGLDPVEHFFLPHRDCGEPVEASNRKDIFSRDVQALKDAKIVVALLDGQDVDSGTCVELGYAYSHGKKIFGIITDFRSCCIDSRELHRPNLMVWGVCEHGNTLFHNLEELSRAFAEYVKTNIS